MFLATVADGQKQLLHGAKGRKTANTHPESAFGPHWALGRSWSFFVNWGGPCAPDARAHFKG